MISVKPLYFLFDFFLRLLCRSINNVFVLEVSQQSLWGKIAHKVESFSQDLELRLFNHVNKY